MKTGRIVCALGLVAALTACGAVPTPAIPGTGDNAVLAKYDSWLADVDALQASVDEAEGWITGTPAELAASVGLPPTATLEEVAAAIRAKIQSGVVELGGSVTVDVHAEAGASGAAEAGTGGASAAGEAHASIEVVITVQGGIAVSEDVQQVLDAVKLVLTKIAGIKPRFEAVLANLESVVTKGRELLASLPNDLQGILAAKIAEYTGKFNAAIEFLGGVSGRLTGSIDMSVTIQVQVTASVSAG